MTVREKINTLQDLIKVGETPWPRIDPVHTYPHREVQTPCSQLENMKMSKEKKCYGSEIVIANTRLPISWAVEAGDYVFLSGCASLDENLIPAMNCGIEEQTTNTLEMMKRVLAEADCGLEDLVKMNVFLKNKADFQGYNTTASKYFLENPPARMSVIADFTLEDMLIEIEATAYKPAA